MEGTLEDFRMNMKYYRAKNDMTQSQLAIECDCSNGMIGFIEAGKARPSFDMILAIAKALKVHPADLFLKDCSLLHVNIKEKLKERLKEKLMKAIDLAIQECFD